MTETTNSEQDSSLGFGSRNRPMVAVAATDADDRGGVLLTILRAKQRGNHVCVYCDSLQSETAVFAKQLGATVTEREAKTALREQARADGREHGFPGVICLESASERIDFEESHTRLDTEAGYDATARIEYEGESNLLIGIPAYNEEVGVGSVVLAAKSIANEVVVVDDGSTDDTVDLARDAGATVIEHTENRGKGAAIKTLLEAVRERDFDAFVLLDGDGQHDPDEIPLVAEPVIEGDADLVIGSRYLKDSGGDETPTYRRFGQQILDFLTFGPSQTRVTDSQSGFRALSEKAVDELAVTTDDFGVETEMIDLASRNGLSITEQPIEARYEGIDGQTQNPLRHGLTVVVFLVQLVRDKHPLAFFGFPGLVFVTIGGLYGLDGYLLYQSTGQFLPVKALGSGFLIVLGMLCIFSGLILNSISNMLE